MTCPRLFAILAPVLTLLALGCQHGALALPATAGPIANAHRSVLVTDASTMRPIAGAAVEIAEEEPQAGLPHFVPATTTDADGRGWFNKPPGATFFLRIAADSYVPVGINANYPDLPNQREFRAALRRGIQVGGSVRNEKGEPIAGALVEIDANLPGDSPWIPLPGGAHVRSASGGKWSYDGIPEDARILSLQISHPNYASTDLTTSLRTLRKGRSVAVMKEGVALTGIVTDLAGAPVAGAPVLLGYLPTSPLLTSKTDAAGRFQFSHAEPSRTFLLVQTSGFAPTGRVVIPAAGQEPVQIKIGPSQTLRGRVTDRSGKAVANAQIAVSQWGQDGGSFLWSARADASGRFVARDWPSDPVVCTVTTDDGSQKTVKLTAGVAEQSIVLDPPLRVSGSITDARTKKPVDGARVICGADLGDSSGTCWDISTRATAHAGQFSIPLGISPQVAAYQLAFEAKGYQTASSKLILPNQGDIHLDVSLEPYHGPAIVVLDPDGRAAQNVQGLASGAANVAIYIQDGQFQARGLPTPPMSSGADGRIILALPQGPYVAAFAGKQGYAIVTSEEVAKSPRVQLKPWCTASALNLKAGKPMPNQTVLLQSQSGVSVGSLQVTVVAQSTDSSDDEGRCELAYCMAGPAMAGRFESDEALNMSSEQFLSQVKIVEGQPNEITIEPAQGRKVIGRVVPPAGLDADWPLRCMVDLVPVFDPPPLPKDLVKMGPDAIQRWRDEYVKSDAAREAMEEYQSGSRSAIPKPDGIFSLDNVTPGKYRLSVQLMAPAKSPNPPGPPGIRTVSGDRPQASAQRQVAVADDGKHADIDLGPLQLKTPVRLKLGGEAPPLTAKTLDGKDVALDSLRGKYVLLQLWAPGCPPEEVQTPAMRAVAARFGQDARLVMISLSMLDGREAVREAAAKDKMTWDQWIIGDLPQFAADWLAADWGGDDLGLFLIDPRGRLQAFNLHGKSAEEAVAKALAAGDGPVTKP